MSADQVAEIAPAIRESLAGGPDMCVTLTLANRPEAWVQFVGGTINAAYPIVDAPDKLLARLGSAALESWEPGKFLTASLPLSDARLIAKWIDSYFETALAAGSDYAVEISLEDL